MGFKVCVDCILSESHAMNEEMETVNEMKENSEREAKVASENEGVMKNVLKRLLEVSNTGLPTSTNFPY